MVYTKLTSIIILAFIVNTSIKAEKLELYLKNIDEEYISVFLVNSTDVSINYDIQFNLSAKGNLSFVFEDNKGEFYELSSVLYDRSKAENHRKLKPRELIGKLFKLSELVTLYDLPKGLFQIYAKLCKNNIEEKNCLRSNQIKIKIN